MIIFTFNSAKNRANAQTRFRSIFFLNKMAYPRPLFSFIFGLFKQTSIQFYNKLM